MPTQANIERIVMEDIKVYQYPVVIGKTNNNEFVRCFHQFVFLVFSTNFSQFKQLKKKIIGSKQIFFSQVSS